MRSMVVRRGCPISFPQLISKDKVDILLPATELVNGHKSWRHMIKMPLYFSVYDKVELLCCCVKSCFRSCVGMPNERFARCDESMRKTLALFGEQIFRLHIAVLCCMRSHAERENAVQWSISP